MKFLNGLFSSTFARLVVISMIAFALLLTGCNASYANTKFPISKTATNSPTSFSTRSSETTPTAGEASVPDRQSIPSSDRLTNSTGFATQPYSVTPTRSEFDSADRTAFRSGLSASSTTSTFQSLHRTRASRCESFLSSAISKTEPRYSAANRATSLRTFVQPPATNLKTLPIGKLRPSFKPPSSGLEIGLTSGRLTRQRSRSHAAWRHWTHGPPNYARSLTESLSASAWPRQRSRDSTAYHREILPRNFTNRR